MRSPLLLHTFLSISNCSCIVYPASSLNTFTMAEFDAEFESVQDTAAKTIPSQASAIKKGGYVVIKNRPCKVVETSTSKTGKHGHAKVHFVALDIFTNKKMEDICPSTHNMEVPVVNRKEYQLIDITDDDFLSLLLDSGETKDDLK